MSKFKAGDKLRVIRCPDHWACAGRPDVGDIVEVSVADSTGVYIGFGGESCYANDGNFELAEDRTNWHRHYPELFHVVLIGCAQLKHGRDTRHSSL